MNKEELQKLLKPLIKECVRETLLESGILSKIITEVAIGLNNSNQLLINESHNFVDNNIRRELPAEMANKVIKAKEAVKNAAREKQRNMELNERVKKISNVTGYDGVFDNLDVPSVIEESRAENNIPSTSNMEKQGTALKGIAPNDAGINISGIIDVAGGLSAWKKVLSK